MYVQVLNVSVLCVDACLFIFRYESWWKTETCNSCKNGVCLLSVIDTIRYNNEIFIVRSKSESV